MATNPRKIDTPEAEKEKDENVHNGNNFNNRNRLCRSQSPVEEQLHSIQLEIERVEDLGQRTLGGFRRGVFSIEIISGRNIAMPQGGTRRLGWPPGNSSNRNSGGNGHSNNRNWSTQSSSNSSNNGNDHNIIGGRTGYNSIRDALGNLRSRLAALSPNSNSNTYNRTSTNVDSSATDVDNRARSGTANNVRILQHSSWIQQLSERLHVVDVAHSSHIPLHVAQMREEERRRLEHTTESIPDETANNEQSTSEQKHSDDSQDEDASASRPIRAASSMSLSTTSLYVSAPVLHCVTIGVMNDVGGPFGASARSQGSTISMGGAGSIGTADSPAQPGVEHQRTSILFASRILAHRLMMEGGSNELLISGDSVFSTISASGSRLSGLNSYSSARVFENMLGASSGSQIDLGETQSRQEEHRTEDEPIHLFSRSLSSASSLTRTTSSTGSINASNSASTPRSHSSRSYDLEMHVHPSVSRRLLSPISENSNSNRNSGATSWQTSLPCEENNVAVEVSIVGDDKSEMEKQDIDEQESNNHHVVEEDNGGYREDSVMDEVREKSFHDEPSSKSSKRDKDDFASSHLRNVAIEIVDDPENQVPPLLTSQASKSMLSMGNSQYGQLPGSLHPSPRISSFSRVGGNVSGIKTSSNIPSLYSWGRGAQSFHDDCDDRFPSLMLKNVTAQSEASGDSSSQNNGSIAHLLQVAPSSSRLGSKSILAVAVGPHHSACATSQGMLYVAGTNIYGCVDPDAPNDDVCSRPRLLDCVGQIRVVQVSCGYDHTAALSSNGSVLTWGSNVEGQLGHRVNGTSDNSSSTPFKGPTSCRPTGMILGKGRKASAIACGNQYTLVLTTRMSLLACGTPSVAGYRDSSSWGTLQELPSLVGLPLVDLSAGGEHAAAVTTHGTVLMWGSNKKGRCGREYPEELGSPVPVLVPSTKHSSTSTAASNLPFTHWAIWNGNGGLVAKLADEMAIQHAACGLEHTIMVSRSGQLLVCGNNDRGQLGIPVSNQTLVHTVIPVFHPKGGRFVSAEAGNGHSLLLDSDGDVWLTSPEGLQCVVKGNSVLAIAAGGDDNSVAIASAQAGGKLLKRQFSVEQTQDGYFIVDTVENLLEEIYADGANKIYAGREIAKRTEELLKYPSVLNSLFLDPRELDQIFQRLIGVDDIEIRQGLAQAIERGLKIGLESLRNDDTRLMYPEAVRCLLLYIKFFEIHDDENIVFDVRGECISSFCETILSVPFEGYKALHGWATNLYPRSFFTKMLVRPLLVTLNACLKVSIDENRVEHFQPSRRAVPVIVAVLSWLHTMADEGNLASPNDFYSDGVSQINVSVLFDDLYRMKKCSPRERSKNFYLCAHPFLLSPGCKRNLLQMESQVEQYKAMLGDIKFSESQREITVKPFFHLEVERDNLLEQTLERIKESDSKDIRKRLRVSFKGEEGLDAGGVTKEFFQLLSEKLFDVHSGLWSDKYGDNINWFNSDNTWDEKGYELIGVLFGLALYNSVLLDVHFPLAVYRKILGLPLGLEDIMDEELRRGLKLLLEYEGDDVESVFCLNFEVTWNDLGEERRLELKPGGADVPVTNDNREEYVLRYVRWLLVDSIQPQWDSFERGVMRVMESSSLDLFLPEELELLVVGSPDLDFAALEANTKYEGGYDENSEVVKNFWRFVKEASKETQIQLLKFATASIKAPIGGLGKMDFIIQRAGPDSAQLPTSHTCFNTLLLPDYGSNYDKLSERLGRAILECEGFGLE